MLSSSQIHRVYGLASLLGMVGENGNDALHELVYNMTGCTHVSEMDYNQYRCVVADLSVKARLLPPKTKKVKHRKTTHKGMSEGQQRKVWQLMYQLKACDEKNYESSLGERLCGIIKKELQIDATPKNPFKWLSYADGSKLIEIVKRYCSSAERKRMRGR